jgi:hypothetical protein
MTTNGDNKMGSNPLLAVKNGAGVKSVVDREVLETVRRLVAWPENPRR